MKMRAKCEILGLLAAFSIESEDIVLDNFILKVCIVSTRGLYAVFPT